MGGSRIRRGGVVALSLIILLVLAGRWYFGSVKRPSFEGKSLDVWLASLGDGSPGRGLLFTEVPPYLLKRYPEPSVAFPRMAPDSMPFLVRELRQKTNWIDGLLTHFAGPLAHFGVTNTSAEVRYRRAALALAMSGPMASNALRKVTGKAADEIPIQRLAWVALAAGPEGQEWFRRTLLSTTNGEVIQTCIWGLAQMGTNAAPLLPLTLPHLSHSSGIVRSTVAWSVSRISDDASILVPALIPLLEDPVRYVRNGAVGSLARLGPKAREAVPALVQSIQRVDSSERQFQLGLLFKIDPDEARRLGYSDTPHP